MKKFVEPELRRIELKLSENIATSTDDGVVNGEYITRHNISPNGCTDTYQYSGLSTSRPVFSYSDSEIIAIVRRCSVGAPETKLRQFGLL